jgi:hypothetical protein
MATQSPKITISELGQEDIIRDMTSEEIKSIEEITADNKARKEAEVKAAEEKEAAKAEVLAKLGLSQEEAKALLG